MPASDPDIGAVQPGEARSRDVLAQFGSGPAPHRELVAVIHRHTVQEPCRCSARVHASGTGWRPASCRSRTGACIRAGWPSARAMARSRSGLRSPSSRARLRARRPPDTAMRRRRRTLLDDRRRRSDQFEHPAAQHRVRDLGRMPGKQVGTDERGARRSSARLSDQRIAAVQPDDTEPEPRQPLGIAAGSTAGVEDQRRPGLAPQESSMLARCSALPPAARATTRS